MDESILIVAPLRGVDLGDAREVCLYDEFFLARADNYREALQDSVGFHLGRAQAHDVSRAEWLFCCRRKRSFAESVDIPRAVEVFQDALMAIQIVKPTPTFGLIFHGEEYQDHSVRLSGLGDRRWPMESGYWARLRALDSPLVAEVRAIIGTVLKVMSGSDISKRNAIHSLQLALEHPHPYISCLLAVMGMEAIFDSGNRGEFEKRLCDLLGPDALAFPDWNSPDFPPPTHRVKDIALHLYMLRSKVAHGADLKKAAVDKRSSVNLLEFKQHVGTEFSGYEERSDAVQYAQLLGEASIYLLCQVLRRIL